MTTLGTLQRRQEAGNQNENNRQRREDTGVRINLGDISCTYDNREQKITNRHQKEIYSTKTILLPGKNTEKDHCGSNTPVQAYNGPSNQIETDKVTPIPETEEKKMSNS